MADAPHEPIHLMCALAVRQPFDTTILPDARARGLAVTIEWAPTAVITKRLLEGATPDGVLVLDEAMDDYAARDIIDPASRVAVVHSLLGVAVKQGAPHPDIGTPERFVETLRAARSVAYSLAGASGLYFMALLDRLAIRAEIDRRATTIPSGFTAECLLDGRADIAIQQISELLVVPGIDIVGPFPDAVQKVLSLSIACLRTSAHSAEFARFAACVHTPAAIAAYTQAGLSVPRGEAA